MSFPKVRNFKVAPIACFRYIGDNKVGRDGIAQGQSSLVQGDIVDKIYDLNILTVDVTESYRKAHPLGFDPEDITGHGYAPSGSDLVIFAAVNKAIYISSSVLSTLYGSTSGFAPKATYGRVKLYRWTKELSEAILDRSTYPPRSAREEWVRERNLNIAAWIENLS